MDQQQVSSQASFSSLQREISKLSDLVSNLAMSSVRPMAAEGIGVTEPAIPTKSSTFTTPPPPPHTLPPITEVSTPFSTPNPPPPPAHRPLQFGNLSPGQLPHPTYIPYTQPDHQNFPFPPPSYSMVTNPTATAPSPSSQQHFTQTINPSSHPQIGRAHV